MEAKKPDMGSLRPLDKREKVLFCLMIFPGKKGNREDLSIHFFLDAAKVFNHWRSPFS